jgi:hypothetical protein
LAIKIQDKAKILKAGAEEQIKNEVNIQVSWLINYFYFGFSAPSG